MKFGYSTLGGPELSMEESVQVAEKYGLQFLELRALEMNLDLAAYFREKGLPSKATLARMPVLSLCSSLRLTSDSPAELEKFLEMAELADQLQAPYIRVFGGGKWGDPITDEMLGHAAKIMDQIHAEFQSKGRRVQVALETHDAFSSSANCLRLIKHVQPPIFVLWDSHHTWRMAGESPRETWDLMGHLVRHVHYKDSISIPGQPKAHKLVLPGAGDYPAAALFDVLKTNGYSGGVSLEWEKLWVKELEPLEEALVAFLGVVKATRAKG